MGGRPHKLGGGVCPINGRWEPEGRSGTPLVVWWEKRLLRTTRCRLRAIRWAQAMPGDGGGVVMIDGIAVAKSYGAEAVIDVHIDKWVR